MKSLFTVLNSYRWLPFFLICFFVALFNDGFMGTDEYWTSMVHYLPAQIIQLKDLVFIDDVKSPLQNLPFFLMAKLAFKLGIEHPYQQYRFVIALLSTINALLIFIFSKVYLAHHKKQNTDLFQMQWGLPLLFAFYFAMPFSITRAMYESLTLPWLFGFAVMTDLSLKNKNRWIVFLAVTFISIAFMLRPQVGLCALALPIFLAIDKRWKDSLIAAVLGGFYFVFLGWLDSLWRGEFHYSLKAVFLYNWQHGSEYSSSPWWTYLALIFILLWGPFTFRKYSTDFWKKYICSTQVFWIVIALFVFIHSLFAQKFERFLICLIPILCLVLWPFIYELYTRKSFKRLSSLVILNSIIWLPASFFPAQKNIISLALYLDQRPEILTLYNVEKSIEWIPELFVRGFKTTLVPKNLNEMETLLNNQLADCTAVVVINEYYLSQMKYAIPYKQFSVHTFETNWIERLSYKLNRSHNIRRSTLTAFRRKENCSNN